MKFICLGFVDEASWTGMSSAERNTFTEQCLAYESELRRGGHFLGAVTLPSARTAATVRCRQGQVMVTAGPHAEYREQLRGLLFLEARDLNHAIQLVSRHPGLRAGAFEVRAALEESLNLCNGKN
jgi:hypothetical protein